ncbi:MAG: DUF3696 domain-containing protein [Bryobacterales bacterium]|nr:DUF3696 domain-containing protein [Bryobacterales bacterium]MDE0621188.1 DUF3696 domain-containing protein [Bryobacterales bacterium]
MLNSLKVENFKAWRTLDIEFGRVTGLFGANSSGKSSILQFLLMLKQTKNATDRGLVLDFGEPNALVNLGTYRDVVHKHDENAIIRWSIDWTTPTPVKFDERRYLLYGFTQSGKCLQTECRVGWKRSKLQAEYLRYNLGGRGFDLKPISEDRTEFALTSNLDPYLRPVQNQGWPKSLPGPTKTHLFPPQIKASYRNADILNTFEIEYESLMDRIFYLGPLREYPRREYSWAGTAPSDVGIRGERTVEAILAATNNGETRSLGPRKRRKPFQAMIAHWLKELGLVNAFEIHEVAEGSNLYRTSVTTHRKSSHVMLSDIGVGVSQVLPALVLLYYVPEGSIVLLEQPEIHLHPSVQSGLADLILAVAKTRQLQVIVESHSEHLLRRLQRRVAEDTVASEDVRLYFASMSTDGAAQLHDLRINQYGEIMNWPENFFGNELADISATRVAGLKRKARGDA